MTKWNKPCRLLGPLRSRVSFWSVMTVGLLALAACGSPPPVAVYSPQYCYRTLAQVDCHAEPLAGEAGRRMGHYEAPIGLDG